jgi:hypothetical protein
LGPPQIQSDKNNKNNKRSRDKEESDIGPPTKKPKLSDNESIIPDPEIAQRSMTKEEGKEETGKEEVVTSTDATSTDAEQEAEKATKAAPEGQTKSVETALSLLLCQPRTGRTHQIRIHSTTLGLPLAGDKEHSNHYQGM